MTFWGFISSLGLVAVIFCALFLTKLGLKRQEDEHEKKRKVRQLRSELVDIDEIVNTLLIYDRNLDLIESLIRYMTEQIQSGLKILPNAEELIQELRDVDHLNNRAQSLLKEPVKPEIPSSDRQIFIIKKHFIRTIKLIKQLHNEGYFDDVTSSDHRSRLSKNTLTLEFRAYILQGDAAQATGETSIAANFYKHAKELMVNSEMRFPERTEHIKEVSKKLSGLYMTLPEEEQKESGNSPLS